jgi:hypothetical protein
MNQILMLGMIGAVLSGGRGVLMAVANNEPVYIASDYPVTEYQVSAKLQREGWTTIEVKRDDRYIEATASKVGRVAQLTVDSLPDN